MADVSHELGSLRFVVDSPLSSKVAMFNNQADKHKQSQLKNPFSNVDGRVSPKPTFSKDEYGKPLAGSLTEMRGQKANMHVLKEMLELCQIINSEGYDVKDEPQMRVIPFGELFNIYNYISDKVVGILLRARKHKLVEFEGEMLFQRRDDDVPIFLLKPMQEIRAELDAKIEDIKRASSPAPQSTSVLLDKTAHLQKLQDAGLIVPGGSQRTSPSRTPSPTSRNTQSKAASPAPEPKPKALASPAPPEILIQCASAEEKPQPPVLPLTSQIQHSADDSRIATQPDDSVMIMANTGKEQATESSVPLTALSPSDAEQRTDAAAPPAEEEHTKEVRSISAENLSAVAAAETSLAPASDTVSRPESEPMASVDAAVALPLMQEQPTLSEPDVLINNNENNNTTNDTAMNNENNELNGNCKPDMNNNHNGIANSNEDLPTIVIEASAVFISSAESQAEDVSAESENSAAAVTNATENATL